MEKKIPIICGNTSFGCDEETIAWLCYQFVVNDIAAQPRAINFILDMKKATIFPPIMEVIQRFADAQVSEAALRNCVGYFTSKRFSNWQFSLEWMKYLFHTIRTVETQISINTAEGSITEFVHTSLESKAYETLVKESLLRNYHIRGGITISYEHRKGDKYSTKAKEIITSLMAGGDVQTKNGTQVDGKDDQAKTTTQGEIIQSEPTPKKLTITPKPVATTANPGLAQTPSRINTIQMGSTPIKPANTVLTMTPKTTETPKTPQDIKKR